MKSCKLTNNFLKSNAASYGNFWLEGIIESIPFPSRPSFLKGSNSATNRSTSTSISSGLGSSISNNNTSSPPSYSRINPSNLGNNRPTSGSVHSNSPKFGTANVSKNEGKSTAGPQPQAATRSASVPSGASALKHQQRSLPAPPGEENTSKDEFGDDKDARDRCHNIPSSFYHNRGE